MSSPMKFHRLALAITAALLPYGTSANAWETQKSQVADEPACVMFEEFPDGSQLSFIISVGSHQDDWVMFLATNSGWPFKEHEKIGDIYLTVGKSRMFDEPNFSLDNGFLQFLPKNLVAQFILKASSDGFAIMYEDRPIGRYPANRMMLAYSVLQECVRAHGTASDPFAK